jgi:hypothetical protein
VVSEDIANHGIEICETHTRTLLECAWYKEWPVLLILVGARNPYIWQYDGTKIKVADRRLRCIVRWCKGMLFICMMSIIRRVKIKVVVLVFVSR